MTLVRATNRDGMRFTTRRVASRWRELRAKELAGEIRELRARPRFELKAWSPSGAVGGRRYTADFSYLENSVRVVEDVIPPSGDGRLTRSLMRWLFKANHPDIDFREL